MVGEQFKKELGPTDIRELLDYSRLRQDHIEMASPHVLHMHKALDQMNIKIHEVLSDLTGASGRRLIEAILAGVSAQNDASPSALTIRSSAAAPAEVTIGREHVYLVDVYTGRVMGESSPGIRLFFRNVENWHRWLGASNARRAGGRMVTGFCNLCFLVLIVSGPFLWIPARWSWRNVRSIALFRGGLSGRARDFNWHNVFGIWCAVPLFAIVLSGVVMSYPWANNLVYRLTGNQPPMQGNGPRPEESARAKDRARQNQPAAGQLNLLWARAMKQVPGWRSVTLRFPPSGRGPMTFTIDTGSGGRPDQRSQLTLDSRSGEIVRWEPFSTNNAGRRLRAWLRFLHTGEAKPCAKAAARIVG